MKLTIPAALARAATEFGEAIAEPGGPRLTYAELHDRVQTAARAYIAAGIAPGDRVAIWAPNSYHWVIAALGALYAGGVLVPVNTRYTAPEAQEIITRSRARALVVIGPFLGRDRLAELPKPPEVVWRIPEDLDNLGRLGIASLSAAEERAAAVSPDQVSDILFTSGTTGRSKGAMSAHRQSLGVAQSWAECGGLSSGDRYLVINPFFHSFGYKAGILSCLLSGATIVPQRIFDVAEAMRLVDAERITVLPGPPTIYQTMLDHPSRHELDLSTLRLAVTGAAIVPVALIERMQRELSFETVLTAYGLTEAVVATMCRVGDDPATVAATSGRAAAQMQVRLGVNDEILLRGPNVMLGYLDDPEATAQAIDPEGWLHTGDIGRLDENGYLAITDRLKDMYICGGFNVYPAEVEQVLARLEGVAESAVIGVPDERLGEVGKAFVVPRPGHRLSTEDIIDHCRSQLANYKLPREVEVREDLPRSATGKPLKRVLREELR
ncbi:acyl-CoA synthetase [Rhizocola hellebori]|uniref:Acyl-CoA synthetase n=1 Tax=Rhizocola hellebori TaxID=1392758 RepID=A0A8J3QAW7_9ACTN|nr:FadD3 family acyl-CoA ligase [Rhizocola hellebori]GIH06230.1 acyl-CoA synthetase [Rhizocola hellebori]